QRHALHRRHRQVDHGVLSRYRRWSPLPTCSRTPYGTSLLSTSVTISTCTRTCCRINHHSVIPSAVSIASGHSFRYESNASATSCSLSCAPTVAIDRSKRSANIRWEDLAGKPHRLDRRRGSNHPTGGGKDPPRGGG